MSLRGTHPKTPPRPKDKCPNVANHTPEPRGYLEWHAWAAEKSKTHGQIRCKGCGLFAIWVPK